LFKVDLLETLRARLSVIDDGPHSPGLRAVLLHIETAFRHLSRGRESSDDTAFTDAIYRTNQAFEGSIKEAYRVLAEQDPTRKRPFDIENYLETKNVFRSRVLKQFTNYRTEWRNPSTHDHKLDFDESEAFLAIVSVAAFACLLFDEIAERISFEKARSEAENQKTAVEKRLGVGGADILDAVVAALNEFCQHHLPVDMIQPRMEVQLLGALNGFLATILPHLETNTEVQLVKDRPFRADLMIAEGQQKVVVEVARSFLRANFQNRIAQVEHYMMLGGIRRGVLLYVPEAPQQLSAREFEVPKLGGRLIILGAHDPLSEVSIGRARVARR
jgi:hypothetical protein